MARRSRRHVRRARLLARLRVVGLVLACAAGLALAGFGVRALKRWIERPNPDREVALALGAFEHGDATAMRRHARAALTVRPLWGLAHALVARADLALEDGLGAEGELDQAVADGVPVARLHQLYAHAYALQGDADQANGELARVLPRYAGYASRVRAMTLAIGGDRAGAAGVLEETVAAAPHDSLAWSDLGRARLDLGDVGGAIAATDHALAADPDNTAALTLRGELVRGQYGLVAALPWFRAALRHDRWYHPALIQYAATLGDVGRARDMLSVARLALVARPGSPQAYLLEAEMAARGGNDLLADTLMGRLDDDTADLPAALLVGGVLDSRAGRWQQAIDRLSELVARQPYNVVARRLLGTALLRSGDAAGAWAAVRPIATRADADSYTLTLAARAFEATGQRDIAGGLLDRAATPVRGASVPFGEDDGLPDLAGGADEAPSDPVAATGLIKGLIDAGRSGDAVARARGIALASPGSPAAAVLLGDAFAGAGAMTQAADAYQHAANLRFDRATMLRLVDALDRSGRRADATRALALFLSQNPTDTVALRLAGQWQLAAGDGAAAMGSLETVRTAIGSRDVTVLTGLAQATAGDPARSRLYAAAAYRLAPLDPTAADAYGWALHLAADDRAARPLLAKAVAIAPASPGPRAHLAALSRR